MKITLGFAALAISMASSAKACLILEGIYESGYTTGQGDWTELRIKLTDNGVERCNYFGPFQPDSRSVQWLNCPDGEIASIEKIGKGQWVGFYSYGPNAFHFAVPDTWYARAGHSYLQGWYLLAKNYGC